MRAVGTHRSRRGAHYNLYVSESGREQRRGRQRRLRRLLVLVLLVAVAAGVLVAGGWAQDLYHRLTGSSPGGQAGSGAQAGGPTSTGAFDVLIATVDTVIPVDPPEPIVSAGDGVKVSSFLGDETRRVYGLGPPPKRLSLIWKTFIGGGMTSPVGKGPNEPWSGSGWTGQPVIVRDKGKLYLLWGAFDRKLHKIDLKTGKVVWEYSYDDIIKSSPTVIEDPSPSSPADRYVVMAGSRRGWPSDFTDPNLAPYRAVSFGTGKELWRLPVPLTPSYSRDVDGSGFYYKGRMYSGVESGWFYKLDPFKTESWNGYKKPKIIASRLLLGESQDQSAHGGNLVLESSPCLLDDVVYVCSGAGHVYGMRRSDLKVVWDYRTGSDMDGTAVPTTSGKLLVAVEKQYIGGHGGILCLDPTRTGSKAVVWFYPTGDRRLADWEGGVIGSTAVNDAYDPWGRRPRLAAFSAIDGNLYVVSQNRTSGSAPGPNGDGPYPTPMVVAKFYLGGSISTPIMVDDTVVAAGYDNHVHLYRIKYTPAEKGDAGALKSPSGDWYTVSVSEKAGFAAGGAFESTPVMWKGRVFIGCRDGSLYCIGDK
jgi:outer membrane protein assembly factor BamB